MRKKISILFISSSVLFGILSLTVTNKAVMAGFDFDDETKVLIDLDNKLNELRAQYIRVSIDRLGEEAEQIGFVEIKNPTYVERISSFASR